MISVHVVPVTVKHKNSSRKVKTFAMLDNCSQGTLIKEDLLKKLKIGGRATSISIKILNGEKTFRCMQLMVCKFTIPILSRRKYG